MSFTIQLDSAEIVPILYGLCISIVVLCDQPSLMPNVSIGSIWIPRPACNMQRNAPIPMSLTPSENIKCTLLSFDENFRASAVLCFGF